MRRTSVPLCHKGTASVIVGSTFVATTSLTTGVRPCTDSGGEVQLNGEEETSIVNDDVFDD